MHSTNANVQRNLSLESRLTTLGYRKYGCPARSANTQLITSPNTVACRMLLCHHSNGYQSIIKKIDYFSRWPERAEAPFTAIKRLTVQSPEQGKCTRIPLCSLQENLL